MGTRDDDLGNVERPSGGGGHLTQLGGFSIFAGDGYDSKLKTVLDDGTYEARERALIRQFVKPEDRVLDLGTAIGLSAMTAAVIVGPEGVVSFDGNPDILSDARGNFELNNLESITARHGVLLPRDGVVPGQTRPFHIHRAFWGSRLGAPAGARETVKVVETPCFAFEDEVAAHRATVLVCDIEGGECELLTHADLAGLTTIIVETHYWAAGEPATNAMVRRLIGDGWALHLGASGNHVSVFRR